MNILTDIATIQVIGFPLFAWLGLAALVMLFVTGIYGMMLLKGKIKGTVTTHRYLAYATLALALVHAVLSASLFI